MADRPYSRIYYVDLQRDYADVWHDDAALATYIRLLTVAEAMWPALPEVPRSARPRPLRVLVDAGLVLTIARGPYYRIKGMDAERTARSSAASHAARIRHGTAETMPNRAEPNQTEPTRAQERAPKNGSPTIIDAYRKLDLPVDA
jgi:hypothetical protein